MQDFRRLSVWQAARTLTKSVYEITARYPDAERYGLAAQMRRAAVSISSNIAEGCGRGSDLDFRRFLYAAMGSACELESETIVSLDLAFVRAPIHDKIVESISEVKRMLTGLIKSLGQSTTDR